MSTPIDENLTILHDDNASFVDYSKELFDYARDTQSISFVAAEDKLYIGFRKPFSNPYIDMVTTDFVGTATYEYSKTSTWGTLEGMDLTSNLSRSGFLKFDSNISDWVAQDVDGKSLYWIRITYSSDNTTEFTGINTVFSDDIDLKEEYREIEQFRNPNDTSFIVTHQAVRKDIVQWFRASAKYKEIAFSAPVTNASPSSATKIQDINQWDFLEAEQVKRASVFWALAKIFGNTSDSIDGKFFQLSQDYKRKGSESLDLHLLTIDTNDDGKISQPDEIRPVRFGRIFRA